MMFPRVLSAGDTAFTIEFGDAIEPRLLAQVMALDAAVSAARAAGRLDGVVETMPTFRSLTVFYDPLVSSRAMLQAAITPLVGGDRQPAAVPGRRWRLPVCYGGEAGPDVEPMAAALGVSPAELIARHSAAEVVVYMLGFLPGFAFMGDLPATLAMPRRHEPRLRVAAGSVAVAGRLTAIYPSESPGGWQILGRCPLPLFDARGPEPALFRPGDHVGFVPIDVAEYQQWHDDVRCGRRTPFDCLLPPEAA